MTIQMKAAPSASWAVTAMRSKMISFSGTFVVNDSPSPGQPY